MRIEMKVYDDDRLVKDADDEMNMREAVGKLTLLSNGDAANVNMKGNVGMVIDAGLLLMQVFEGNTIDRVIATNKDGVKKDITDEVLALKDGSDGVLRLD